MQQRLCPYRALYDTRQYRHSTIDGIELIAFVQAQVRQCTSSKKNSSKISTKVKHRLSFSITSSTAACASPETMQS